MAITLTNRGDIVTIEVDNQEIFVLNGDDDVTVVGTGNQVDGGNGRDTLTVRAMSITSASATTSLMGGWGDDALIATATA
jgi:hypothetical protein